MEKADRVEKIIKVGQEIHALVMDKLRENFADDTSSYMTCLVGSICSIMDNLSNKMNKEMKREFINKITKQLASGIELFCGIGKGDDKWI